MKKNMLAVLILVVLVVNLTLTAYTVFTVIPNAQKTDELITRILQVIDLELQSPLPSDINIDYSITDIEKHALEEMTTNLATGEDGKSHFAVINATLSVNTKDEDYKKLGPLVDTFAPDVRSFIMNETSKYSFEELKTTEYKEEVKNKILSDIQALFNSKMIVDCTVDYLLN